jgi:Holliday junction resolvasome RuvABC endonuclease subunit
VTYFEGAVSSPVVVGIDLGARKAALSVFHEGELASVGSLETPSAMSRAKQLSTLAEWSREYTKVATHVFIEEPLVGRGVRASLQIAQTAGAVMATLEHANARFISNTAWKKALLGNGNANKEMIETWLKSSHPVYATLCGSNQDRIDATCIGQYGVQLLERADQLAEL